MTILYVATDGTQFTSRKECLNYEDMLDAATGENAVVGRDSEGCIVEFKRSDFFLKSDFITCKNNYGVEALQRRAKAVGFVFTTNGIHKPGSYYWDSDTEQWLPVHTLLKQVKAKAALLNRVINDFR